MLRDTLSQNENYHFQSYSRNRKNMINLLIEVADILYRKYNPELGSEYFQLIADFYKDEIFYGEAMLSLSQLDEKRDRVLEYVEVERSYNSARNQKKLYLENDLPEKVDYENISDNQLEDEKNEAYTLNNEYKANLASKRPIERSKETLDIEPLDEINLVPKNKKLDKLEIDDPW